MTLVCRPSRDRQAARGHRRPINRTRISIFITAENRTAKRANGGYMARRWFISPRLSYRPSNLRANSLGRERARKRERFRTRRGKSIGLGAFLSRRVTRRVTRVNSDRLGHSLSWTDYCANQFSKFVALATESGDAFNEIRISSVDGEYLWIG